MNDFAGRTAVITGAASGFGLEFARIARGLGMRLVLADVDDAALAQAVLELGGAPEVLGMRVDVADSEQVAALAQLARERMGSVHLLFNNAGVGCGGYVWESSESDWNWVLGVNLMGVVHGLQHFVPSMLESSRAGEPAHIVNTASIAGWLNAPLMGVYSASKHAVVSLTESLYQDLLVAHSRIGVSLLSPAFVSTGIGRSHRNRPAHLPASVAPTESQRVAQAQTAKAVASGRLTAADVAQITFDAIRANRFYVFTHEPTIDMISERLRHAIEGLAPADPYATRPERRPTVG